MRKHLALSIVALALLGDVSATCHSSNQRARHRPLVLADTVDGPNKAAGITQQRLDRTILSLESADIMRVEFSLTLGDRNSASKLVRFRRTR